MTHLIATFFYVGHLVPAPGTWGSAAALPAALLLFWIGGPWLVLSAAVVFFVLGWWATAEETRGGIDHDPSEVVIDEVVGQWIALMPVLFGAVWADVPVLALYPGWIAAFLLFRLFDIWKPGPVGWADKRDDALGVMLDDVIAGLLAGLGVVVVAAVAHLGLIG